MLGEVHSLKNDFPEMTKKIEELTEKNVDFEKKSARYNEIDKKIRTLELNKSPIDDIEMIKLKQKRSKMKDLLYNQLKKAS